MYRRPRLLAAALGLLLVGGAFLYQRQSWRLSLAQTQLAQAASDHERNGARLAALEHEVTDLKQRLAASEKENAALLATVKSKASTPAANTAAQPPKRITHADVEARHKRAQQLAQSGQSAEALAEYLWCYDEGMVRVPSFTGVRSSFLLGEIARLGQSYPPALDALRSRRDELAKALAANPGEFTDISDYASLNRALDDTDKTVALFESIPAGDRRRGQFGLEVYEFMAKARRYGEALEAHSYRSMVMLFDGITEERSFTGMSEERQKQIRESNRAHALKMAAGNLEVLIGAGQTADAHDYVEKILGYDDSAATQQMIRDAAARAGRPDLFAP